MYARYTIPGSYVKKRCIPCIHCIPLVDNENS